MRFNQRSSARHPQGGRLQIGIGGRIAPERVAGFASESVADFKSESVADFLRNPQALAAERVVRHSADPKDASTDLWRMGLACR